MLVAGALVLCLLAGMIALVGLFVGAVVSESGNFGGYQTVIGEYDYNLSNRDLILTVGVVEIFCVCFCFFALSIQRSLSSIKFATLVFVFNTMWCYCWCSYSIHLQLLYSVFVSYSQFHSVIIFLLNL